MTRPVAPSELLRLFESPSRLAAVVREGPWPLAGYRVPFEAIEDLSLEGGEIVDTDFELGELHRGRWRGLAVRGCTISLDSASALHVTDCRFEDCAFLGGQFREIAFERCAFLRCRWEGIAVRNLRLHDVQLEDVSLRGLALEEPVADRLVFRRAALTSVGCFDATLDELAIEGGRVERLRLGGGRLTRARCEEVQAEAVELTQTAVQGLTLTGGTVTNCSQSEGRLVDVALRNVRRVFGLTVAGVAVHGLTLAGVHAVPHLVLTRSLLRRLTVSASRLLDLEIRESEVDAESRFDGADVDGLDLSGSTVEALPFQGGRLGGPVRLDGATIRGWTLTATALDESLAIRGRPARLEASDPRLGSAS